MRKRKKQFKQNRVFIRRNHQIRAEKVRVIDKDEKQVGVLLLREALKLSDEQGVDLVEIAPKANPPVVKLIEFDKFQYQQKKKKQEERRGSKTSQTKQVQFGPFIGPHDLEIKLKRARGFLSEGDKVKFLIRFRGRQITKKHLGELTMQKVIDDLEDVAKIERDMHMEGRQLVMIVTKR